MVKHKPGPQADAAAAGAKTYLPAEPCCRGHMTKRETRGGRCLECRLVHDRIRYNKTRDRVLARHKRKNATEEVKETRKAYREANKERDSARYKARYAENLEKERARSREKYIRTREHCLAKGARWRDENREHHREQCRQWARDHPERALAVVNERRARKESAIPSWSDQMEVKRIYALAKELEKDGIRRHVDHIVPLKHPKVCGLHIPANLKIVPAVENMRKGNRFVVA
jgi:hypothetical protein